MSGSSSLVCFCLAHPIMEKMFSGPSLYTPPPVDGKIIFIVSYETIFRRYFVLQGIRITHQARNLAKKNRQNLPKILAW